MTLIPTGVRVVNDNPALPDLDQAYAAVGDMGIAWARFYNNLIERGVPKPLAARLTLDCAHEWTAGTFNKGLRLPS